MTLYTSPFLPTRSNTHITCLACTRPETVNVASANASIFHLLCIILMSLYLVFLIATSAASNCFYMHDKNLFFISSLSYLISGTMADLPQFNHKKSLDSANLFL